MRLTEKYDINYKHKDISKNELDKMYACLEDKNILAQTFWKLGKLEDIEEELGVDLITLFKALKDMIYVKDNNKIKKAYPVLSYMENETYVFDVLCERIVKLTDYGKTWALTKEELL